MATTQTETAPPCDNALQVTLPYRLVRATPTKSGTSNETLSFDLASVADEQLWQQALEISDCLDELLVELSADGRQRFFASSVPEFNTAPQVDGLIASWLTRLPAIIHDRLEDEPLSDKNDSLGERSISESELARLGVVSQRLAARGPLRLEIEKRGASSIIDVRILEALINTGKLSFR